MSEAGPHKSERLINLTMALLASRRYMSKSQIFKSVAGYTGSPETMERMFERDKNDLRELGLDIEVGTEDPLFDDEAGYRINPQRYTFDIGEIDSEELSLLSLAASRWQNSLFSKNGQRAIRKVESIASPHEEQNLSLPFMRTEIPADHFEVLWEAVESRRIIHFTYHGLNETHRRVAPYGLGLSDGFWYLIGLDLEKEGIRRFKVVRTDPDLTAEKNINQFVRPIDFNLGQELSMPSDSQEERTATVRLRVGKSQELRSIASLTPFDEDWDSALITYTSQTELFEEIARSATSAILVEPIELRSLFVTWMKEKIHG